MKRNVFAFCSFFELNFDSSAFHDRRFVKVKKVLKSVLVVTFIAGGIIAFASTGSAEANNAVSVAATRTLYRQRCAECHGNDGKSNTKKGRETEASDLTDPGVKGNANDKNIRIITNGKGEMPGFKRKLSPSQIASVARYIKTL